MIECLLLNPELDDVKTAAATSEAESGSVEEEEDRPDGDGLKCLAFFAFAEEMRDDKRVDEEGVVS